MYLVSVLYFWFMHVFFIGAPFLYMAIVVPLGFLLPGQPHYGGDM